MYYRSFLFSILIAAAQLNGSIIKKPPVKPTEVTYSDLLCTEEQKSYIYEIISTMAENGKLTLLFKQNHLKELGDRISNVHPLKFLAAIFTDPYLKSCMNSIWDDYFKHSAFLDGLAPSLSREVDKGKLQYLLKDFAAEVQVSMEDLQGYVNARDWENFVLYLIQSPITPP